MEGPDTGHPQQGCRGGAWPRVPGPGNHDGRDLGPQLVTGAAQQPLLQRRLLTWQGEAEHPSRSVPAFKEKELPAWQREEGKPTGPRPLPPWRGAQPRPPLGGWRARQGLW